jgi:MFS family permease
VVHGFCYAFFFASVYIFVDEFFPGDARTSAQTLFNFLILGVGPLAGNFLCGWLGETFVKQDKSVDFNRLFLVPLGLAVIAALVLLAFFFPPEKAGEAVPAGKPADAPEKPQAAPAT